jgi:hypothetical protein
MAAKDATQEGCRHQSAKRPEAEGGSVMKTIAVLLATSALIAGSLALWPSPSHSAQKGRAASPSPGKSSAAPGAVARREIRLKKDYMELKLRTPTVSTRRKPKVRLQDLPTTRAIGKSSPALMQ